MTVFPGEWLFFCSSRVVRVWSQRFFLQKWTIWGGSREQKGTGEWLLLFQDEGDHYFFEGHILFVYISGITNPHPVWLEMNSISHHPNENSLCSMMILQKWSPTFSNVLIVLFFSLQICPCILILKYVTESVFVYTITFIDESLLGKKKRNHYYLNHHFCVLGSTWIADNAKSLMNTKHTH